jgi:multidrug efflux pump subunit AcrB
LIADKSFSMPSLIGLIMLMGIATKNSILLVEYAIEARRGKPAEGDHPAVPAMNRWDAMLDACHKRARPIVMTTIAMGAGMLPIAVGWGARRREFPLAHGHCRDRRLAHQHRAQLVGDPGGVHLPG